MESASGIDDCGRNGRAGTGETSGTGGTGGTNLCQTGIDNYYQTFINKILIMNIETHYNQLIAYIESLDYSNVEQVINYASKEIFKYSAELSIMVMVNALIRAPEFLREKLSEQVISYVYYEGSFTSYKYIKSKLIENNDNSNFYHKELFEYLLEVLEDKYKEFKVDLKSR